MIIVSVRADPAILNYLKSSPCIIIYQLQEIPAHLLDSISVSSTRIREAISAGDMETATHLLGYTIFFQWRSGGRK